MKERDLTAKQKMFVKEYLLDLNATKACLRSGYDTENPDDVGSELILNPRLKQ
jgi:phage terminase small subunit